MRKAVIALAVLWTLTFWSWVGLAVLTFIRDVSGAVARPVVLWLAVATTAVSGFEGLRRAAYLDPVGIPTICFGATDGVRLGQTKTLAECEALLQADLLRFDRDLTRCLPSLPQLPAKTRAALVSWTYNVGPGAACSSTLVRLANRGDLTGACNQLLKWNKATTPGGIKITLPGLTTRRTVERQMCLEGLRA